MWLFVWDTAPSKVFVWWQQVSKIFVWATQVRPSTPPLYKEVEWIWTNWTQRIDTWIKPDDLTYWFECKFSFGVISGDWNILNLWGTNTDNYRYWWGGYNDWNLQIWYPMSRSPASTSNSFRVYGNHLYIYKSLYNLNWNLEFSLNNESISGDNITVTNLIHGTSYNYWVNWNVFCQAYGTWNYTRHFNGRLYYMKIYHWSTLVRDYVPMVRLADNEAWLYDKVTDVFYTNDDAEHWTPTAFTVWPDVN